MRDFENKRIEGFHASRYIASWLNIGGKFDAVENDDSSDVYYPFEEWLMSIQFEDPDGTIVHMSKENARYIRMLATNGDMELENSALAFLKENMKNWRK